MLDAKVDWLSFTVPYDRFRTVLEFIPGGVTWLGRGWMGYTDLGKVGETGSIAYSPDRPDMGIHMALGGNSLGILAGMSEFWADLPGVVSWVHALGGKVTRLDVAFDDRAQLLDLDVMWEYAKKGWNTSRWKKAWQRDGVELKGGNQEGHTLEFGRRVSDAFLRAYDKRLERMNNGDDDPGHWVRVELELKRERADAAAELYKSGDEKGFFRYIAKVLMGYLTFREPNARDSNKRRWPIASWWATFLGTVERAKLAVGEKVRRTVEHVREWVSRQVAPSLAVVFQAMGESEGLEWVRAEARSGRFRWKGKHRAMLQASSL